MSLFSTRAISTAQGRLLEAGMMRYVRFLSVDFKLEVYRLRQHLRIRRQPRRRQRVNDKCIRDSMDKYSSGRYTTLEYLSAVSHSTNITGDLQDDNSDTEDYSWNESAEDSAIETNSEASMAYSNQFVQSNRRDVQSKKLICVVQN